MFYYKKNYGLQSTFQIGGPSGEVMVSYTELGGLKFLNILAANMTNGYVYTMLPSDTDLFPEKVSI